MNKMDLNEYALVRQFVNFYLLVPRNRKYEHNLDLQNETTKEKNVNTE